MPSFTRFFLARTVATSMRTLIQRKMYLLSVTRPDLTTSRVTEVNRFRGRRNRLMMVDLGINRTGFVQNVQCYMDSLLAGIT